MIFGGGSSGAIGTGIVFSLHDNFSGTAQKIQGQWRALEGTTSKATARMGIAMRNMKMGFAAMAAGAVLLAPVLMGVGKSMEFNATMSEVYAKSGTTNIAIQKELANEAMRLGEATKFSAKQAAEGQAFLAMAGFKTSEIMTAMPGVLNLAAAGNLDLARSADIASNILTAMGLKAKDMARVADVLALGATSANVSVEMLGDTFAYAAASAKGLGWSLEQTTAMAGMLGNIGIQGSSAGTAIMNFNRFLAKLDDKKIAALGMKMSDIVDDAGNLKAVPEVFAKIMNGVKDMGNMERANVLNKLFGPRGNKAIAAFESAMASGFDFSDYIKKLEGANGAAQNIADQMMNNLKGDLTILGSVWETTLIKIGSAVEPILRPIIKGFSKVVSIIGKIANHPIGKWFIRLTAVAGALAVTIGGVVVVMNLAKFAAAKAALGFAAMGKTEIAATFASKGLARGLMHVTKAALSAVVVLWPILLIGAAIAGVIFLIRKALKSFDEVLNGTAAPAKGFLGFFQKLGGVLRGVAAIWKSANGEGFSMSEQMANALDKLGILDFVVALGTWIVRIKHFFRGVGIGIKAAWSITKPIFKFFGDAFRWFGKMLDKIGIHIGKNTSPMDKWVEAGKIVGIVIMAVLVPAFYSLAVAVLSATWPILLVIAVIVGIILVIKNWGKIMDWFKELWDKVWTWIVDKSLNFWNSLKGMGQKFKDWGAGIIMSIKEGIATAWGNFKSWLFGLFDNLLGPIKKALKYLGIELGGEDVNLNVEGNTEANTQSNGKPSPLALVNAVSAGNFRTPEQTQITNNDNSTEIIRDIKIDMDGREIRREIDLGAQEDLNRQ